MKEYKPSKKVLERYASVMVNFALGSGKGIKPGETVYLVAWEYAKPFYAALRREIVRVGGHVISDYRPNDDHEHNMEKEFFTFANDQQIGRAHV